MRNSLRLAYRAISTAVTVAILLMTSTVGALLPAASASAAGSLALTPNTWSTDTPLNTPRAWVKTTLAGDGRIYAVSGQDESYYPGDDTGTGILTTVEAFDPATHVWTNVASLQGNHGYPAVATGPDGKVYALGGEDASTGQPLKTVEAYDPATNTWTQKADMPTARTLADAVLGPDGKIYVLGGQSRVLVSPPPSDGTPVPPTYKQMPVDTVEVYDTVTDTWATTTPMTGKRDAFGAALGPDGRIYVVGGEDDFPQLLSTFEAFDTQTATWSTMPMLPVRNAGLTAAMGSDGRFYAIDGESGYFSATITNAVWAFDFKTHHWTSAPSAPTKRWTMSATTGPNGSIYVIGGEDRVGPGTPTADPKGNVFLNTVEVFTPPGPATPTPTATATEGTVPETPTATATFVTVPETPTATATEVVTVPVATSTPTATDTATVPAGSTNTSTPTVTATNPPSDTSTPTATDTATVPPGSTNTSTPTVTATDTATVPAGSTNTSTPTVTATNTPANTVTTTATASPVNTNTPSSTATITNTATPTDTATNTATPCNPICTPTVTPTVTPTSTSSNTPTVTSTSTATEVVTVPQATSTPTSTEVVTVPQATSTATEVVTVPEATSTPTATDTATVPAGSTNTSTPTSTATEGSTTTPTATVIPTFGPSTVTFTLGDGDNTATSNNGQVTIIFPAGSIPGNPGDLVTVSFIPGEPGQVPLPGQLLTFQFTVVVDGQTITQFNGPVTIQISYPPNVTPNVARSQAFGLHRDVSYEDSLHIVATDSNGVSRVLPTHVDGTTHEVSAPILNPSRISLVSQQPQPVYLPMVINNDTSLTAGW